MTRNIICIRCPKGCRMTVESNDKKIGSISGYGCPKGLEYAKEEFLNPTRILPTTVRIVNGELPLVPVKTADPIPREMINDAMKEINKVTVKAPVKLGQVIIKDLAGTGVKLVATRSIARKVENGQKTVATA
ncbi:DUF1667 domain-containing protein [Halothermothrix orenii]|uniref:Uncharacterized protein with conserved CXXC pairs n=1 Tax=Halothermothrix orenii (strain H 168 / OCM 544 / DSM 9562) TaxID=373903 RepID=B8CWA0_HALOH|nr:DUF1667 domain-containing protein [Halothermothrix orenii]ACL69569.1 uncharacterized protein with conserved CXXC pairs [Halothermothrix orenii H 168]